MALALPLLGVILLIYYINNQKDAIAATLDHRKEYKKDDGKGAKYDDLWGPRLRQNVDEEIEPAKIRTANEKAK